MGQSIKDKHTARQAIIDYCERENVVNPMGAIRIPYELVEDLLVEYCTTSAELLNTQRGLCGTNAELSKAWNEIEKLKAEIEALRKYALALMTGPYIGMDKEQRELVLESELIALRTGVNGG